MKQVISKSGYDAPITGREEDFYDRWPVAKSISEIIATAPSKWSTRIGLFAPWGDGKTSVLNFVEQQQLEAGNIVIRYAPWGASTPEEVWRDFGKVLIAGLKRNGVKLDWWAQAWHWIKAFGPDKVKSAVTTAGKMAEASGHLPGASAGSNIASMLITKKLAFSSEDIQRLMEKLGTRRVVVFIDDLDRTEASVVPKLLLVLRELLDFEQFAFVLAFDRKIVATALEKSNQSWGKSGDSFLDKVIDFRVDLPKPTADQVRRLGLFQFGALCPFVPRDSVEAIVKLLPSNPRKLKLLTRAVASMKQEVERHEDAELDWGVILLLALVRAESEGLASWLLERTIGSLEDAFAEGFEGPEHREAKRTEEFNKLMQEFPELVPRAPRIKELIGAWRAEMPRYPGERIRYQASFALAPHCITWSEFRTFFTEWQSDKRTKVAEDFINERIDESQARPETVQHELATTILSHYATILEDASHVHSKLEHQTQLNHAADALSLLLQCVSGNPPLCALTPDQLSALWSRLHDLALQWRHFTANEGEPELRKKEVQTLMDLGDAVGDPILIYEMLRPGHLHDVIFEERTARLKNEMSDALRSVFEPKARDIALSYVKLPGEMQRLRSRDERRAARYLLTSPDSSMFSDHISDLMEAWEARRNTQEVVKDAGDYLSLLLRALAHGDQEFCTADDRKAFIKKYPELMALLWNLSVSEPSQFRMLQDMRAQRALLIEIEVPEASLQQPDWLKAQVVH